MALSMVVLPEPVPPEMRTLSRQAAAIFSKRATPSPMLPCRAMTSRVMPLRANFRIEIEQPSSASGGATMLTRLPSASRASNIGQDSSMRRPIRVTIRWATFMTWALSRKRASVSSSLPRRST